MTTFKAHCTVYCAVGYFNVKFANQDAKPVRYRTVLCAYHVQDRNVLDHETANGSVVHAVHEKLVYEYHEL